MQIGGIGQDTRQAVRMREVVGQGEGLITAPQGLIWIAKKPQRHGQRPKTAQPGVGLIQQVMGIVLLWIVDSDALLQVCTRGGELSQPEQSISQNVVATQEQRRIAVTLSQDQEL